MIDTLGPAGMTIALAAWLLLAAVERRASRRSR